MDGVSGEPMVDMPRRAGGRTGRVIVVGNAAIDLRLAVDRLPEPGETVVGADWREDLGGKGANQAVIAARAGAAVRLAAAVGQDEAGDRIVAALEREGIATDAVVRVAAATSRSVLTVDAAGENTIVTVVPAATAFAAEPAALLAGYGPGDVLLMQGNLRHEVTLAMLREGRRRGLATVLNPAPIRYSYEAIWPAVGTAVLNAVEIARLGGEGGPEAAARRLLAAGVGAVVVTQGAAGALLVDPAGCRPLAAPATRAVDTVGAGDVVCGCLAAGLALGQPLPHALRWGMAAAALTVTRPGTQSSFPSRAELHGLLAASAT